MIDVEISGPVAKKEYEKLKKVLEVSGENICKETKVSVSFVGEYNHAFLDIEIISGQKTKVVLKDQKKITETTLTLDSGQFSLAAEFCAKLGYTKGVVSSRVFLRATYGGVSFSLVDSLENDSFYYEAVIVAENPESVKEAKNKIESLARKFKLPIWGHSEMLSFFTKLNKQANYVYDYSVQGSNYFKEKFGI